MEKRAFNGLLKVIGVYKDSLSNPIIQSTTHIHTYTYTNIYSFVLNKGINICINIGQVSRNNLQKRLYNREQ